jgi:hypothetical protein
VNAASAALALVLAAPLVQTIDGVQVDWSAGMMSASAGAAADFRLPSPDQARPGAERRARAAAEGKLRSAIEALSKASGRTLPESSMTAALARARAGFEYQSNGGVRLVLQLAFAQLEPAPETSVAPVTLKISNASPARALYDLFPTVIQGENEAALGWAVYRVGSPPAGTKVLTARRDRRGRLELSKGDVKAVELSELAGRSAVIYLEKGTR